MSEPLLKRIYSIRESIRAIETEPDPEDKIIEIENALTEIADALEHIAEAFRDVG